MRKEILYIFLREAIFDLLLTVRFPPKALERMTQHNNTEKGFIVLEGLVTACHSHPEAFQRSSNTHSTSVRIFLVHREQQHYTAGFPA